MHARADRQIQTSPTNKLARMHSTRSCMHACMHGDNQLRIHAPRRDLLPPNGYPTGYGVRARNTPHPKKSYLTGVPVGSIHGWAWMKFPRVNLLASSLLIVFLYPAQLTRPAMSAPGPLLPYSA